MYSPTDAPVSCLRKTILTFTLKIRVLVFKVLMSGVNTLWIVSFLQIRTLQYLDIIKVLFIHQLMHQ